MYNYIQSMERNIYTHARDYFYDNHNFFHIQKSNYAQVVALLFPDSAA